MNEMPRAIVRGTPLRVLEIIDRRTPNTNGVHLRAFLLKRMSDLKCTDLRCAYLISRDGGKWWSKDHHLVVIKIVKNVAFSLKLLKNGERKL